MHSGPDQASIGADVYFDNPEPDGTSQLVLRNAAGRNIQRAARRIDPLDFPGWH